MNLVILVLSLNILLIFKSLALDLELADENLSQNEKLKDYEELMTFTYQSIRSEVDEEMAVKFEEKLEQIHLKALETKRAELDLEKGDPGYDDVRVDFEEVEEIRLNMKAYPDYDYDENEGFAKEDIFDFHSSSPKERQLEFEKSLKMLIKEYLKDNYRNNPDFMAQSMLKGYYGLLKANVDSTIIHEKQVLEFKYYGKEYEPTKEELKRVEDLQSNLDISLRKLKRLENQAFDAMMEDDSQKQEYVKETNWQRYKMTGDSSLF